jgi:hypothetical protein
LYCFEFKQLIAAHIEISDAELSLRGSCHFLLALASFFEVCHQLSHFVYFFVVTVGPRFIDYFLCLRIQSISLFGLNAIQTTLLATSVDRLLAMLAPVL